MLLLYFLNNTQIRTPTLLVMRIYLCACIYLCTYKCISIIRTLRDVKGMYSSFGQNWVCIFDMSYLGSVIFI